MSRPTPPPLVSSQGTPATEVELSAGQPASAAAAAVDRAGENEPASGDLGATVCSLQPRMVEWRRHIHRHPELSNREQETAEYVFRQLKALGVEEIRTGVARHGVVGTIRGSRPGPVVALRADMDALPVQEETGFEFASENVGVMHACGHDAHVAMLLGAAAALVRHRDRIQGEVRLLFQPAEEGPPVGEAGGASLMIRDGALEPKPVAIYGLHVSPDLDTGAIGYTPEGAMASVDRFAIRIEGRQSHGAFPWEGIDPIVLSAHVITAIQTIVSRRIDPRIPVVVTVGSIHGGSRFNVIPDCVELQGTVRAHDETARETATAELRTIAEQTAAAHGGRAVVDIEALDPVTYNDPALLERMLPTIRRVAGADQVVRVPPNMGGEDFSFYSRKVPALFLWLGARRPGAGATPPLHTPTFTIDEAALAKGASVLAELAVSTLERNTTAAGVGE